MAVGVHGCWCQRCARGKIRAAKDSRSSKPLCFLGLSILDDIICELSPHNGYELCAFIFLKSLLFVYTYYVLIFHIYIYIGWNPFNSFVLPQKKKFFSIQNKGHLGSRYNIYIYITHIHKRMYIIHPLTPFEIGHLTENYKKKLSCAKARSVVRRCLADVCGVFRGADGCHSLDRRQVTVSKLSSVYDHKVVVS